LSTDCQNILFVRDHFSKSNVHEPQIVRYIFLVYNYGPCSMGDARVVAVLTVPSKLSVIAYVEVPLSLYLLGISGIWVMFLINRVSRLTNNVNNSV
jgi:hypothetical protein